MPKAKIPHALAVARFEHKRDHRVKRQAEKAEIDRAETRRKKRERQDAARLVKITHLRQQLHTAARFPSVMTVQQLRAIAANPDLPAEARVEAARLLTLWLFAEPADLDPANGQTVKRRKG